MSTHSEATATQGRYADGRTAASKAASLRLTPAGIEISLPDDPEVQLWPYPELQAGTPLHRGSKDVLLRRLMAKTREASPFSATAAAGATVYVADQDFVHALMARAPNLTASRARRRFVAAGLVIVLLTAALCVAVWALELNPARTVAALLPPAVWRNIGDTAFDELTRGHRVCANPRGQAALTRLVTKLSTAAAANRDFNVRVVDWPLINAFTLPGGRIVLTSGLINVAASPDELAGVIAHEIGHGLEWHPETSLVRALGLSAAVRLVFGGADPVSNVGMLLLQLRYSREAERVADARAVEMMRTAKIPAKALADFFLLVKKREGSARSGSFASAVEILSTHPLLEERAQTVGQVPPYPVEPAVTPEDAEALKAICAE